MLGSTCVSNKEGLIIGLKIPDFDLVSIGCTVGALEGNDNSEESLEIGDTEEPKSGFMDDAVGVNTELESVTGGICVEPGGGMMGIEA